MRTRDGKEPAEIGGYDGDPYSDFVGRPFDPQSAWHLTVAQAAEVVGIAPEVLAAMVEAETAHVSGLGSDGSARIAYDEARRLAASIRAAQTAGPDAR